MEELIIGERLSGKTSTLINKFIDMKKGNKVILVNTRSEADRLRAKLIAEYGINMSDLMTHFKIVTYNDLLNGKLDGFHGSVAADEPLKFLKSMLNNHGLYLTICTIDQDPSDIIFLPRSV